jgi:selenide,water dikinase
MTPRLTELAGAAGCAAKLGAGDLAQIVFPLADLFPPDHFPDLLIGLDSPDDAGVYRLNDEQALIFTTDFFPPVVDDPYYYGAIAAANALSDVYAMGGRVLMALNLVAFPLELDGAILREILRGGAEKVKESGGVLIGGHSIMDKEPKYGLAVVGLIHPERVTAKTGAQVGDVLLLTKPLGVGLVNTALKRGQAKPEHVEKAMRVMATLNKTAAEIAQNYAVHGASDVTGYSLMGHGYEMVRGTDRALDFFYDALHWVDGAKDYAHLGMVPGGTGRNQAYYGKWVDLAFGLAGDKVAESQLYDPQTSGGLLLAVAPTDADPLLESLLEAGVDARRIGEVVAGSGRVRVL